MNSASLYLHIPFCLQKCKYCDFFSIKLSVLPELCKGASLQSFLLRLVNDIKFLKDLYKIDFWETVYIGGGTPSLLPADGLNTILNSILQEQVELPVELTMEVNPEDLTSEYLCAAFESGINRLSVGVQSLSDNVLHLEKRRGSRNTTLKALELISRNWKGLYSFDVIAGLAGQTCGSLLADLDTLFTFKPHHISLYALCTEKELTADEEDRITDLWLSGKDHLLENSYIQYEVSNFSYKGKYKSLHNENYWNMKSYIGAGPGATGTFIYTDENGMCQAVRFSASKNIRKWLQAENRNSIYEYENITIETLIKETIMMGFRLKTGICKKDFFNRFRFPLDLLIPKTLEHWQKQSYISSTPTHTALTETGSLFLNRFLLGAFEEIDQNYIKPIRKPPFLNRLP